jgi:hypothetical protein
VACRFESCPRHQDFRRRANRESLFGQSISNREISRLPLPWRRCPALALRARNHRAPASSICAIVLGEVPEGMLNATVDMTSEMTARLILEEPQRS